MLKIVTTHSSPEQRLAEEHADRLDQERSGLLGQAPGMRRLRQLVRRLVDSDAAVLVRGENGTGKELVAQALHRGGRRAAAPLVEVNCAAVPPGLMESEFFGHERGSFTSAVGRRVGVLEAAGDGTLFLDEVAELSPELQAKLLRVLETRRFARVGATPGPGQTSGGEVQFRARVVAATHQDLEERIRSGRFRQDLYFRLNVVPLDVPALSERREDIPLLCRHFLQQAGRELALHPAALEHLVQRAWPGNVRELRNAMQRLSLLCDDGEVTLEALARLLGPPPRGRRGKAEELARQVLQLGTPGEDKLALMEDLLIQAAMEQSGFNRTQAARLLGVHRKVVERRWLQPEAAPAAPAPLCFPVLAPR